MKDGPVIASIAALLGDPARANMLSELMGGRALTVSELARAGGVTVQTASSHLARMHAAKLLSARKQGRHRYFRLSGADVAEVLEALMGLAQRTGATRTRTGPQDVSLRAARVCYDHLAGEQGVALLEVSKRHGLLEGEDDLRLTDHGRRRFAVFGIDVAALEAARRPLCRPCLDWSERRSHLGGALGAAILSELLGRRWVTRGEGRVLTIGPGFQQNFEVVFC